MCLALYDERTALLATIVFAVTPSLLKWHFQVRGYSWYFPFHSPANDSLLIDSIDAESKVATISFVRRYFRVEHLEFGVGNLV